MCVSPISAYGLALVLEVIPLAQIPGRKMWLAAPVAVVSVLIVLVLVVLAAPMVPAIGAWIFSTAQNAVSEDDPVELVTSSEIHDCRDLYPQDLWADIMWTDGPLLSQKRVLVLPDAATESLAQSLEVSGVLTCQWQRDVSGSLETSLMQVPEETVSIAQASLTAAGYECGSTGSAISCRLEKGGVVSLQSFGGSWWLSTAVSDWDVERYGERLTAYLWGS